MRRTIRVIALAATVAALGLASACGGAGSGGGSGSASTGGPAKAPSAADASGGSASSAGGSGGYVKGDPSGSTLTVSQVRSAAATDSRSLVRTAALTVSVADVPDAARQAEDLTVAAGGLVSSENTADDPGSPSRSRSTLTLLVPPARYADLLDSLAGLGTRVEQTQSTDDVTAKVVDVQARIAAQRASVARVQALLAKAKTLGEVVSVEGELTRRQADLESLESQQKALAAQIALSTVTLTLESRSAPAAPAKAHLGFLSGLRSGWDAFVAIVLVGLTVLGAVLPFAAVTAVVGLVAWRIVAARRHLPPPASTEPV